MFQVKNWVLLLPTVSGRAPCSHRCWSTPTLHLGTHKHTTMHTHCGTGTYHRRLMMMSSLLKLQCFSSFPRNFSFPKVDIHEWVHIFIHKFVIMRYSPWRSLNNTDIQKHRLQRETVFYCIIVQTCHGDVELHSRRHPGPNVGFKLE